MARVRPGPYRRLIGYFLRHRGTLGLGLLALVVGRLLLAWAPDLLRRGVNALQPGEPASAAAAWQAAWQFLGVAAAGAACVFVMRRLIVGASREVEMEVKRDIFAHLERLPAAWFDRMRTGDLMSRLTSDVEAVRFALGPGLMYVGGTLVTFPAALVFMGRASSTLMLAVLVPLLAILVFVKLLSPSILRRTRAVQDRTGDLSARAQESFAGGRVVRAYATEQVEVDAFREASQALVAETLALARVRAWMTAGLFVLGGAAELVVLVLGGRLAIEGTLSVGDLLAYLAWVSMLIWPMISVGWVVSALQRSAAAAARIEEVLTAPPEQPVLGTPAPCPGRFAGRITARGLSFTYPGSHAPALEDVSFDLPAGGTLALVGPVGSGTSTLLRLLARLYEPPPGTLSLDGVDVTRIPLPALRAAVAAVPQDAFLFSESIAANLAYGARGTPPRARLEEAARMAGLEQDLEALPQGLDTVVGERGVTLSGGQKQRVTLARALLREAPVLLLDDALSAVDTHTEEAVLERLGSVFGTRTTVVAAHRLSTVRHATHILVLDAGHVVEQGTHAQLLARGGWYARTHAAQRAQRALEDLA